MALYRYVKTKSGRTKKRLKLFSGVLLIGGTILLANAALPILLYQLKSKANFSQKLLTPTSEKKTQILGEESAIDYSKPSSWFPTAPKLPPRPSKITHYSLSIPKLKIEEAVVEIGGEDLMKSLIHFSGTAPPGQGGNTVVFGHSVLPQFFNPKNYKTIFSTLPALKEGDEILVNFDGILYRYRVFQMQEVKPTDISVLTQHYDSRHLTLVTCVPPGTYLKRLVVRAKLQ